MLRPGNAAAMDLRARTTFIRSTVVIVVCILAAGGDFAAAQGPPPGVPGQGPVVLEGEFEATYEDDDDQGRLLHFLHTDNRRIPIRFQNGTMPDLPTGARVRLTGNLAVDGEVTATGVTVLSASTSRTLGPQKVLVILFNFSNNATQPWSMTTIANVNEQVKSFFLENTYGQTILSFDVAGYYTIAATNTTCDYYGWTSQAESAASSAGINLNAYDRRIFAFPNASACKWAGMGNVSGPRSWINGYYQLRVVAHEQGHNFGDHHSRASKCQSGSCSTVEYGDDRDIMGSTSVSGHFNAFQKERLGWLNYGSSPLIRTVGASGDYWIDNYEMISGSTKALRIWNPAKNGYYYVESRAKTGFDANIAAGVTLHLGQSGISYQLDLDPMTSTYDSTLDVGQTFTDAELGLSVETLSTSVDGALIRVNLYAAPCTSAAPTVTLAPAGAMQYAVSVTNNNSSSCEASVFNITAAMPSGWSASFSPYSSGSLSPGSSGVVTLSLTAPEGATGSHPFSVTATDTATGKSSSSSGSVLVASSLSVSASAVYEGGRGNNRALSIRVTALAGTQPVAAASVTVIVTDPKGGTSTLTATTASNGVATLKHSLKAKDPSGNYQVRAKVSSGGVTGEAAVNVTVP
jgi:hypothetical protein